METFKQVGRVGFAIGIWLAIVWVFTSPKRILILGLILFISFFALAFLFDDTDKLYYVNVNSIELLDAPFGNTVRILAMNDTLRMVKELNDDWYKIAVGTDSLYFYKRSVWDDNLGFWQKIQRTPFTKEKALRNTEVTINHPDGYMEVGSSMLKNGDIITIIRYDEYKRQAIFDRGGNKLGIDVQFLTVDWESILKKYPSAL